VRWHAYELAGLTALNAMAESKKLLKATAAGVRCLYRDAHKMLARPCRWTNIEMPTHVTSLIGINGALATCFSTKTKAIAKIPLTKSNTQTFGSLQGNSVSALVLSVIPTSKQETALTSVIDPRKSTLASFCLGVSPVFLRGMCTFSHTRIAEMKRIGI
jgi:hypothetical protein